MAKESHDVKLARIEEGINFLRGDISEIKVSMKPLVIKSQNHSVDIALLKRDNKWKHRITNTISGALGAIFIAIVDYFRR